MPSRSTLIALLVSLVAIAAIAVTQPGLAASVHKVKQRDDVFLLPSPNALRAATLGYKAAATDLLWAKLVLEHGLHWQERRPFPDVTRYVDGIIALEPDFPTLYRFVDTMLVYNPTGGTEDDARTARKYLEIGTEARPNDPEVWMQYGQFTAFLAASFLKDPAEIDRWRVTGAHAIARAVLLGANVQRSLAVGAILDKAGERDANIAFLNHAYAITEDPEMRQQYLLRLGKLHATAQSEESTTVFEREWRTRYPFMSRGETLLIGPRRPPATCAGPASYDRRGCPRDWTHAIRDSKP